MSRVLLTGGGGFVGQWLARALLGRGDEPVLAGLGGIDDAPWVLSSDERRAVRWISVDVRVQDQVAAMVDLAQPDLVIHLAAIAFPPQGDADPALTYDVNVLGCVRLLATLASRRKAGVLDPVTVVVGSAVQYGTYPPAAMPLTETTEQRPLSAYAASKAAQEVAALQAYRAHGLRIVCTRSFNHSGAGHGSEYLLPSLVRRVKALKPGEPLTLGNDAVRDYLHVADVADAYIALAERGIAGEVYNVASGVGLSARQLAADVLLHAGVHADISTEPSLVRPTDIPILIGSPAKLMRDTGWMPRRTHAQIIDDLLHAA
ncbi:MAG TPA: GDP-mannose 4,6-dehydratase [Gemmatimonadaceae bacterium]|nr:GDP-mannose 4,6-dehydratase [Gemmatimonadaceae bacterium]